MVRKKQTPKKTKKRVALTTLSPTVRNQVAPLKSTELPSQTTWNNMMSSLDTQYNTDEVMLDKYEEPTQAQWDEIETADPRYNRPQTKNQRKKEPPKERKPQSPRKSVFLCCRLHVPFRTLPMYCVSTPKCLPSSP